MNPVDAMENILYARAYTHEHQDALLTLAAARMCQEKFGVLIMDSITSLFRVDFSGRGSRANALQTQQACS
jgi:meiotic recombination protein DMC1